MIKHAVVYKKQSYFIFQTYSETTVGVLMGTEPIIIIDIDSLPKTLGDTLIKVLSESKSKIPHPKSAAEFKIVLNNFLKYINEKSFSSLMKKSMLCNINEKNGNISILPNQNMGMKGGFVPIFDKEINISSKSCPEDIGNILIKAFEFCK